MTIANLRKIGRAIEKELNLFSEGWVIEYRYNARIDVLANASWEPSRHSARIQIKSHAAVYTDSLYDAEMAQYAVACTLCHELLHVRLEGHLEMEEMNTMGYHTPAFEWSLDQLAKVVVSGMVSRGLLGKEHKPRG